MEQAGDMALWQYAKQEGFVIATRDADFQEIALVHGYPPFVIWLKTENPSKAITFKLLVDYRDYMIQALENKHLLEPRTPRWARASAWRQRWCTAVTRIFRLRASEALKFIELLRIQELSSHIPKGL